MPYYFKCDVCNYREEVFDGGIGCFDDECDDCAQEGCVECLDSGLCDDCRHRRLAEEDDEEEEG